MTSRNKKTWRSITWAKTSSQTRSRSRKRRRNRMRRRNGTRRGTGGPAGGGQVLNYFSLKLFYFSY